MNLNSLFDEPEKIEIANEGKDVYTYADSDVSVSQYLSAASLAWVNELFDNYFESLKYQTESLNETTCEDGDMTLEERLSLNEKLIRIARNEDDELSRRDAIRAGALLYKGRELTENVIDILIQTEVQRYDYNASEHEQGVTIKGDATGIFSHYVIHQEPVTVVEVLERLLNFVNLRVEASLQPEVDVEFVNYPDLGERILETLVKFEFRNSKLPINELMAQSCDDGSLWTGFINPKFTPVAVESISIADFYKAVSTLRERNDIERVKELLLNIKEQLNLIPEDNPQRTISVVIAGVFACKLVSTLVDSIRTCNEAEMAVNDCRLLADHPEHIRIKIKADY